LANSNDGNHTSRQSEQAERFAKAARELGCDNDEKAFEKRLKEVATSPPPKPNKAKQKKKNPAK
jgi:hypothetical protein